MNVQNADDRSIKKQSKMCKFDRPVGVTPIPTSDDGKSFEGWYENPDGTGEKITSSTKATVDKTYYAKWRYRLTMDTNGGYFDPAINFNGYEFQDDSAMYVTPLPDPIKEGWEFAGWYKEPAFENQVTEGDLIYLTAVNKLYAKWEPLACTVTLDAAGCSPTFPDLMLPRHDPVDADRVDTTHPSFAENCEY